MTTRRYRKRTPTVEALEVSLLTLTRIQAIPGCTVVSSPLGDGVTVSVSTGPGETRIASPRDYITLDPQGNLEVGLAQGFHEFYEPVETE